jgi:hypothetical protein
MINISNKDIIIFCQCQNIFKNNLKYIFDFHSKNRILRINPSYFARLIADLLNNV